MSAPTLMAEPFIGVGITTDLTVALVNNSARGAVASTERQFRAMLNMALPGKAPRLTLYRLTAMIGDGPQVGLCGTPYLPLEDLLAAKAAARAVDAIVVTGMQPMAARLQDEPAWPFLAGLADLAEKRSLPVLWSCLAAHAAMLHLDGIGRKRLPAKLSGLYACDVIDPAHPLMAGLPSGWMTPHSRYNGVMEAGLAANGYEVLSRSAEAGADAMLRRGTALSLFLQGHPEYESDTLLKEYRRDAKAFFSGASSEFPAVPANYFDQDTETALTALRERTFGQARDPAIQAQMVELTERAAYRSESKPIGARLVANWLQEVRRSDRGAPYLPARLKIEPELAVVGASPSLFPPPAERLRLEGDLTVMLADALQRVAQGRVSPTVTAADIRQALGCFNFDAPVPMTNLMPWVIGQLEHGLVHMTHPRYFGLFNPAPAFPAECADRIAAAFNPQLASATTSPMAVAIDAHVIAAVAARAGFGPDAAGHFTSGGTEANATALTCALTNADPRFAIEGVRGLDSQPTLYVSQDAHLAWFKIAHQAGIGRAAVRLVATDGNGQMDLVDLRACIARDRAQGCLPVMIIATAGTTGAGMVDPLPGCAALARAGGLWFHVDAAWGGALLASDALRGALDGIALADSITIDAHKWLAATMGCGMFLTSRPAVLSQAFRVSQDVAPFMPSNDLQQDPYVTTAQWSRRFLGLRLFMMLAAAGWDGIARHVERSVALTALLRTELLAVGWTIVNDSPMAVLCAEPPPGSPEPRLVAKRIVASGEAWLTTTRFEGRDVVRICFTNGRTTPHDLEQLVTLLREAAAQGHAENAALFLSGENAS